VIFCCAARPNFSDITGSDVLSKDDVTLPGTDWYWLDNWDIDLTSVRDSRTRLPVGRTPLSCGMRLCCM
jgi:hypothetical protein